MKKILGLDLGVGSIGWALIETTDDNKPQRIIDIGVRVVPLNDDNDSNKFTRGQDITTNIDRTQKRTARKCYDRYQQRREALTEMLKKNGMMPDSNLMALPVLDLWQLRSNAVTEQLTLPEIGRVLYHINQKRGYKHAKDENGDDKKQRDYVAAINERHKELKEKGLTIGQHFFSKLKESEYINDDGRKSYNYRIKEQVLPRQAYEEEFDKIMACQKQYYPTLLTEDFINHIRNHIIFYQRKLKSCKHLVSVCEFERRCFYDRDGNVIRDKSGNIVYDGPRVAPKTSPLFQLCKNWEAVNNIHFRNRRNDELFISREQRKAMVDFLETRELLKLQDIYQILGITKKDGWWAGEAVGRGIKGNSTRIALANALSLEPNAEELLRFNLKYEESKKVDEETGEIKMKVSSSFQDEPLYRLWHTLYSIKEKEELSVVLKNKFGIENEETIQKLYDIDFVTPGYGNKSSKAICRILPYLQEGLMYSEACEYAGFRHSESLTSEENNRRELMKKIPNLQKNELRQPVVEKILNQMINIYNGLSDESMYGKIDEVRIELARELRQSKDERKKSSLENSKREKDNQRIIKLIQEEGVRPSRNTILKYRLWEESNKLCFYCNQPIGVKYFLEGSDAEREHIIPKALLFDNSFSNQVCACRNCNKEKKNRTAFDFMRTQLGFEDYLQRVNTMFLDKRISKAKHEHLLASYEDYIQRKKNGKETEEDKLLWEAFIDRQLRLSQYIAKKAQDILFQGCRNVWSTSGSVTDFVRHIWGFDTVLHELNLDRARMAGQTEIREIEHKGQQSQKESIVNWSKRLDHRHHAVDALAIACTKQSIIQRLNNLNASREKMSDEINTPKQEWHDEYNLLEEWVKEQQPFSHKEVVDAVSGIFISMKAGKKVVAPSKRKVFKNGKPKTVQTNILVPRGALHEEQVYGRIQQYAKTNGNTCKENRIVFKYKLGVGGMGFVFNGKETIAVVKDKKTGELSIIDDLKKSLNYVVDHGIRKILKDRLNEGFPENTTYLTNAELALAEGKTYDGTSDAQKALDKLRNLTEKPLYFNKKQHTIIRSVRCFTGLSAVQPVRYKDGKPISFVLTKNNHHSALYVDSQGKIHEMITTFWHAVERKKYGIPTIIQHPSEVWDDILQKAVDLPEEFLKLLPQQDWTFVQSFQQNEMFILGMSDEAISDALNSGNKAEISSHLYRVQSISNGDYWFRLHTETMNDKTPSAKQSMKYIRIKSISALQQQNPYKMRISVLGKIINS